MTSLSKMMGQEKAERLKKLHLILSRIKGRQDHQIQLEMRSHLKDRNQLKDQDRQTEEQIQAGGQTVDLIHQEEPLDSI